MTNRQLTPHQKIVRAAKLGRGVRLSVAEAYQLGVLDDAVVTCAENDDQADEERGLKAGTMLR